MRTLNKNIDPHVIFVLSFLYKLILPILVYFRAICVVVSNRFRLNRNIGFLIIDRRTLLGFRKLNFFLK